MASLEPPLLTSSAEAAAESKNQTSFPSVGWTILAGKEEESEFSLVPAIARFAAMAFSSPVATIAMLEAELITGSVNVILSGGGLGESVM